MIFNNSQCCISSTNQCLQISHRVFVSCFGRQTNLSVNGQQVLFGYAQYTHRFIMGGCQRCITGSMRFNHSQCSISSTNQCLQISDRVFVCSFSSQTNLRVHRQQILLSHINNTSSVVLLNLISDCNGSCVSILRSIGQDVRQSIVRSCHQ